VRKAVQQKGFGRLFAGLTTSMRDAGDVWTVALTSTLWVTLGAVVVCGYATPLTFIAFMTVLQRRTPHALMGRVSAAVETVMAAPQAVSLALGALLVTVLDFHIIFAIMAGFTGAAVVYLLVSLRGKMFRSDSPLPAPPLEPSRLI
jgi:predicted MFS family arabinose efflux permease